MALQWVVVLECQFLGHSVLQLIKLYVSGIHTCYFFSVTIGFHNGMLSPSDFLLLKLQENKVFPLCWRQ